jgi:hypothetical protein
MTISISPQRWWNQCSFPWAVSNTEFWYVPTSLKQYGPVSHTKQGHHQRVFGVSEYTNAHCRTPSEVYINVKTNSSTVQFSCLLFTNNKHTLLLWIDAETGIFYFCNSIKFSLLKWFKFIGNLSLHIKPYYPPIKSLSRTFKVSNV